MIISATDKSATDSPFQAPSIIGHAIKTLFLFSYGNTIEIHPYYIAWCSFINFVPVELSQVVFITDYPQVMI